MLRHIVMWKFRPGTEAERDLFLTGLHKAVSALCKSIRTDRAAVDCLLPD